MNLTGDTWLDISISRGSVAHPSKGSMGMVIAVKADPRVEEFIKTLGDGQTRSMRENYHDKWIPFNTSDFQIYNFSNNNVASYASRPYVLTFPGGSPRVSKQENPGQADKINLSFLRVAGIGSPEGIKFGFRDAYSEPFARMFGQEAISHVGNLLKENLLGFNLNFKLVEQKLLK